MIRSKAVNGIVWVTLALWVHVWPGMVGAAHGQGSRKDDIVFNTRGVPLAGATVRVCAMPASGQPCTPLAQLYSDAALTQAMANPTTSDGMGNYSFYAAPGKYEIEISGPGITTKQLPNVILPSDPSAPTFNSLSTSGGISAFTLNLSGNLTVNGSTSVVGNLASGSLTLNNQGTAPGAASAGTVNLYAKTQDKRLYYKDETGTEVGPITSASGAQTNQANTWTAPQNFGADTHTKGPNPFIDVTLFGGYTGPNYQSTGTGSISSGNTALTISSASDYANGQGILVLGAGAAPVIATPQAPTVTPYQQIGTTNYTYCVAATDWYGGRTPCGAAGTTSTGFASFGLQSYSISGWSSTNGLVTITTSANHNIPTSKVFGVYPQVEIQQGSTNSWGCEGAWTLVAVPSAKTVQLTRYGYPDSLINACSGGTLRVLPKVDLSWDDHVTVNVTNYSCSGSTASLALPQSVYGPNGTWVVPWAIKVIVSGASDSHYNGTFVVSSFTSNNSVVNYPVSGGTCGGVATGNLGGTVSYVPGKAVKNHLIYRCAGTAAACALPANAGSYALVGVAIGSDAHFTDNGATINTSYFELGDASTTAPTAATNGYLSTTIASGGGTTALTLANAATTTVSGAKVFHDNTPNLMQACAAIAANTTGANSGRIVIPQATNIYQYFPVNSNFDMVGVYAANPRNCPSGTTLVFRSPVSLGNAILVGNGNNFVSDSGSTNCVAPFYQTGSSLTCIYGTSYPLFYFEPEQSSNNYFQNLVISASQPNQTDLYYDEQLNGDGVVSQRYDNVHLGGGTYSVPLVDKTGFGRFWTMGGWSTAGGNFATKRTALFGINCGQPAYNVTSIPTSILYTDKTYSFGTAEVNMCGQAQGHWQHSEFKEMLTESGAGPSWLINTAPYGVNGIKWDSQGYADFVGGAATPLFDLANSWTTTAYFVNNGCANGYQTLLTTGTATNYYSGVNIVGNGCPYLGVQNYRYENTAANVTVESNYNRQLMGSSQIFSPMAAPGPLQSWSQLGAGNVPVGTYTYCLTASDLLGGETGYNTGSCSTVTVTGTPSVVQFTLPASFPSGATGLNLYINNALANANGCLKPQYTTPGGTYTYNYSFTCGNGAPTATTAAGLSVSAQAMVTPKIMINGEFTSAVARSEQNIFLPGALTSTWTASTWTPDKAVTVTRMQVQAKTAPAGCSTNAVVRLTDGTNAVNLTVTASANDSGAVSQNYAAGTPITISVQTAAAGCTTSPADVNVTVQYRMQ